MKVSTYLLVITSIISCSAFAIENIEPDNDRLLLASCMTLTAASDKESAKPCIYFITGFLFAAQATDTSILNEQSGKKRKVILL